MNHEQTEACDEIACAETGTVTVAPNDFPVLVLRELVTGTVEGVLMHDSHVGRALVQLADTYVEATEVEEIIDYFRLMAHGTRWSGWYKKQNIDSDSLADAISATPQNGTRFKYIVIYRDGEWLDGKSFDPNAEYGQILGGELKLKSVADFHGTRVSAVKLCRRHGLDAVRSAQTIRGEYGVLKKAFALFDLPAVTTDFEAHPGVEHLCDWWNANAPQHLQTAGTFRAYIWNEAIRAFAAGDPEEPTMLAEQLVNRTCFSLFEEGIKPVVALVFCRGREFNTRSEWGTDTYSPNGEMAWCIGTDLEETDEARYAVIGMRALRLDFLANNE